MTNLVELAMKSGMSLEDIAILQSMPGGGMVDLGLAGPDTRIPPTVNMQGGYNFAPQTNYVATPSNYKINPRGNRVGDAMVDAASVYGDLHGQFTQGLSRPARQVKAGVGRMVGRGGRRMAADAIGKLVAVPGMATAGRAIGALAPAVGAVGGAMAVGDLVTGQESGANKAMDATAMTIGGILGSVGGPLGTATGVGIGKMASDGVQYLFGDKKSPEERKMEEALLMLNGGRI